jgi:hypothetical protein
MRHNLMAFIVMNFSVADAAAVLLVYNAAGTGNSGTPSFPGPWRFLSTYERLHLLCREFFSI